MNAFINEHLYSLYTSFPFDLLFFNPTETNCHRYIIMFTCETNKTNKKQPYSYPAHQRNEFANKTPTTVNAINTGATETKYKAPYPTQSGRESAKPCRLSVGSLPMGGRMSPS